MKTTSLREVVAARLAEWMNTRIDLDTQVKVAERSGIGQSSVQRILSAEVNPTLSVLEQLADAFDKDVADLLCRADEAAIGYDRQAYKRLPDYEKVRIEAFIKHVLTQGDAGVKDAPKAISTKPHTPEPRIDAGRTKKTTARSSRRK